jgi:hypothetical protein
VSDEPLEIDAEGEVDVEEIMRQIRAHIARRQGQSAASLGATPPPPRDGRLGSTLYDELYQANATFDKAYVSPYLTSSHVPLVGGAWQRVRRSAHNLVIFYTNRLAAAQVAFNHHVVRVLNELVRHLDEEQSVDTRTRLTRLEQEVAELRARLDDGRRTTNDGQ